MNGRKRERELLRVVAAPLVVEHLQLRAVREAEHRHPGLAGCHPAPVHVAQHDGVHEGVVGDREAEDVAGARLDLVDPVRDGVRQPQPVGVHLGLAHRVPAVAAGRRHRLADRDVVLEGEDVHVLLLEALAARGVHRVRAHPRQRVVGVVVRLVQDAGAGRELASALPVVGAQLEDQSVGHLPRLGVIRVRRSVTRRVGAPATAVRGDQGVHHRGGVGLGRGGGVLRQQVVPHHQPRPEQLGLALGAGEEPDVQVGAAVADAGRRGSG